MKTFPRCLCLIPLAAALCLPAGCRKAENPPPLGPGVFVGERAKPVEHMDVGDVIVRVNGVELTRGGFDKMMSMHEALIRMDNPGMQDFEVKGRMGMRRRSSVNDFVSRELLLQEAARRGLETTGEGRAVNEAALRALEARQKKTMAEIYRAMGENGALFKKRLDEDALIQTLRLAEHGDRMRVGDADIGAYYERHKAYIERCAATNRFIMARGGTFVAWVRDGEDFAELADRFSEFGDGPGGEWGTFFPVEIDDPQVRKAAVETPVGGVAGPFDTEDGMVVIKVLAREGAGAESLVNQNPLTVKLARIGLRMFENHSPDDPLPSREDVRKALEIQRLEEVQREWLPNLRAAACIEYPNGTNFWGKAAK